MPSSYFNLGVVSARSGVQPWSSLQAIVALLSPVTSAHSARDLDCPFHSMTRLLRRLRACETRVAHSQLSLQYPSALSLRSSVMPVGGCPMSARKFGNDCQRSQTLMPRPPWSEKYLDFGESQR